MYLIINGSTPTITFLMVDSTDSETAETSLSPVPTVYLSKNGGAFAASTNAATEIGRGWYKVVLTSGETDTDGDLLIEAEATGCEIWRDAVQVATKLPAYMASSETVALATGEQNKIADHVLRRGFASMEASSDGDALSFRSLAGAVAKLVNGVGISGATLTIYKSDDTTALGTQTVTTGTGDPITGVDTD